MVRADHGAAEDRWAARPVLAAIVRGLAFVIPLALSTAFATIVSASLPPASSRPAQIVVWLLVAGASTGVLILADRVARRLLPLAALLSLSIVFPDDAPSRYQVARNAAGTRNLQARIDRARRLGVDSQPVQAAALVLELVTSLHHHDPRTRGHSERVHLFTEMLAQELKLPEEDRDRLRWAALVHDVGKLTVDHDILNKPGTPDGQEWDELHRHPVEGARLCSALRPWMGQWWHAIEQHHEHYDGGGYPRGLAGDDISYGARIVSVADSFEVMTAARSYKRASSAAAGREELARCAGAQFDPRVVRAFLNISLGRLRLALGPLAWFAQFPAVDGVIRAGGLIRLVGGLATAAATAVVIGPPTLAIESAGGRPVTVSPAATAGAGVADAGDGPAGAPPPDVRPSTPVTGGQPAISTDPIGAGDPPAPPGAVENPGATVPPPAAPPSATPTPSAPQPRPTPSPPSAVTPGPTPTPTPPPLPSLPSAPPRALADAATTAEDTPTTIDVLANDTDLDTADLELAAVGAAGRGAVTANGDDTASYAPDPDSYGIDTFTYDVTDGTSTDTATVVVTVTPVNDAPDAADDATTIAEDGTGVFNVLLNDTDADGDPLAVQSVDAAGITDGTLQDLGAGTFRFTPDPDWSGAQLFTYVVADPSGATGSAAVAITISATPDPPTAGADTYVVEANTTLAIPAPGVLANDSDPDDDPLTAAEVTPPAAGTLTLDADGSFTYDAPAGPGTHPFTYRVDDGTGGSDTGIATITVQAAPLASEALYLDTSGADADTWDLVGTPPAPGDPEPDHDGDGDPGLTIAKSSGNLGETDGDKFQHWTTTFGVDTTYTGQVRLELWSRLADPDLDKKGHYELFVSDCAAGGAPCSLVLHTHQHVDDWNVGGDADGWVLRDLALGSVDHTFTAGRMLRVRLMFRHEDTRVALSQARPTRLVLPQP